MTTLFQSRLEYIRFLKFVAVGGFAALINVGSRVEISQYVNYRWSVAMAYLCGMTTAFILSKLLVFEKSGRKAHHEFFWFTMVNIFSAAQVWIISVGLAEYYFPWIEFKWNPELVAHFVGVSFPVITSYYGHKHLSFRPRNP
ncbi:MAG: GtrA family protein [Candidatus Methylumidiphilus sp.]